MSVGRNCTGCLMVLLAIVTLLSIVQPVTSGEDFYALLGVGKEASQKEIRQGFKKKALVLHPDKNPDKEDAHDVFLKINRAYEVLKDEQLRKKYDEHGEEGLKDAPSGGGYQSWKFYQHEFGLYDDDPNIITLSHSDFETSVKNTQDVWFVNFYSPHCGHCHDLAPTWKQLAQELEGVVRIGAVNCGDDWMLCRQMNIHGYPSLMIYPKGEKFNGNRSIKELTRFALKWVAAKVTDLWSGNYESVINDPQNGHRPWVINFCGDSGDCMQKRSVTKMAAMLNDLVNVGGVDCRSNEALCSRLGTDFGVSYFEADEMNKDQVRGVSIDSLDPTEVSESVLRQLPDVSLLDEEALENLNKARGDKPWLVHFINGKDADLHLRKLPMLLDGIEVGRVNCELMRGKCNELHMQKLPSFVLYKVGGGHEIHHGRMVVMDIAAFAKDSAQSVVTVLGPADFPERVIHSSDPWLVDFFAPWCPPCMRLLPEFRKASKNRPYPNVHFGTVDCTIHTALCATHNVHSYPTTIFYNKTEPHHFHGHHDANAIIEFIEDTLKPPVQALTPETFDSVVSSRVNKMVLVDFFAPWCGPCRQLAPEWRKLSKMLSSTPDVIVTHVDCVKYSELCSSHGVTGYPTVRLYPKGITGHQQHMSFNGWHRDAQSLRAWAFQHMPSKSITLTDNNFAETVLKSSTPWLIDYHTPWCGHCQHFAPEFERIAQTMEGVVRTGKVDCDVHRRLCQSAQVQAYPTVRFYVGVRTKGTAQNAYGQDIDSQDADYIISILNHWGFREIEVHHDEL